MKTKLEVKVEKMIDELMYEFANLSLSQGIFWGCVFIIACLTLCKLFDVPFAVELFDALTEIIE